MAKNKKGYYSLTAINERSAQRQVAATRNAPVQQTDIESAAPVNPNEPSYVTQARQQGAGTTLPGGEDFKLPDTTFTEPVLPETWDYKGATTNMKGEELQEYQVFGWKLAPKGFDPNGDVYFGGGLEGWLKKFAYKFAAEGQNKAAQSSESKQKQDEGLAKLKEAYKTHGYNPYAPLTEEQRAENTAKAKQTFSGVVDVITGTWGVAENSEYKGSSIISPILTTTRLAVEAAFDVFQTGADVVERIIGMNKTMREYSEANGSKLPDLEVEFDPIKIGEKYQIRDELVNTFMTVAAPALSAYQAVRFWTAPGTFKEKQAALAAGWTENKILYSELVSPTIEEEYRARVKAGEDGNLLAMELQDPWAELGFELILDPFNLFAAWGKTSRFAGMVEDAKKSTGIADDLLRSGIVDDLNDIQNVSTPAQASSKMDDIAVKLNKTLYDDAGNIKVFGKQEYKLSAMTATGNRNKLTRSMGNFIAQGIGTIKQAGGSLDDVTDWFAGMLKLSSKNLDEVKEGFAVINKSKVPNTAHLSQSGLETSVMLRNIIPDGDVVKFVKKLQTGDWNETVKVVNSVIEDATKFAYPTVNDMADAARLVDEDMLKLADDFDTQLADLQAQLKTAVSQKAKQGIKNIEDKIKQLKANNAKLPSKNKLRLAKQYQELKRTRPGVVRLAQFDRTLGKIRNPINSFFSGMYFSLSPGYAFRNAFTNAFQMVADGGLKTLFMSDSKIDDILRANFGGELPAGLRTGFTLPDVANIGAEDDIVKEAFSKLDNLKYSPKNIAAKAEVWAGRRVFYKFWKDTMDSMLKAGSGLPKMDEWIRNGFSEQMVNDFVELIKANKYNVSDATQILKNKYANGSDLWRQLDNINDDVKKALSDPNLGIYDELVKVVNDPQTTQLSQVQDFFARAKQEIKAKAAGVANDPIGVPADSPAAEHIAEIAQRWGDDLPQSEMDRITVLENRFGNSVQDFNNSLTTAQKKLSQMRDALLKQGQPTVGIDQRMQKIQEWKDKAIDALYNNQAHKDRIANNAYYFETLKPKVFKDGVYSSNPNDYINAWDEAYMGPRTKEGFRNWKDAWFAKAREARVNRNEEIWDAYFADILGSGTQVADNLGDEFAPLFTKAKQNLIELQNARNHVYNGEGQVFYRPPAFTPAQTGTPQNASNIAKMASQYGLATLPKADEAAQVAGASNDKKLLNIINKYLRENTEVQEAGKFIKAENPLSFLNKHGGISQKEFSDIFGGYFGRDKAGIPPGLVRKTKKNAIDEIGRRLAENGFILPDKAEDYDYVREYLRSFVGGGKPALTPDDAEAAQLELENLINNGYPKLDDVPADLAEKAFQARSGIKAELASKIPTEAKTLTPDPSMPYYDDAGNLIEPQTQGLIPADPGYVDGAMPSPARAIKEQQEELLEALAHIESEITKRWGMRSTETLSQAQIDQLAKFSNDIADKVNTAKYVATSVGERMRDFTLLPYGQTTQLDHAMSYIFPYQFWYSRTYKNWSKRLVTNADLLAGYAKVKDAQLNSHRDLPDWWKYNVKIPDFLGLNGGNPMMLNLEATIWPLNGITGVDFNDPEKRTNWFTSMVDDMGKFGPSVWTPISTAIGAYYAMNGEKEIAQKWATRLIPQTATIKAISSYWGTPIELDPNVRIFNGDGFFEGSPSDPYEESRISRALAAMESEGKYTKEQLIEAARTHKGEIWDEAYRRAVQARAPGQIMSTLFGVGFKARNEADIQTDQFYSDYARMRNLHENGTISDEQYKQGFNELREKYPFMDIILLSRRAGMGREAAYAYNVISRIPPGMSKEIYEIIGVDPETAQKFYDSGGKLETLSETERDRFMAAMVDAGAMLAIPNDTTRQQWTAAKNMYSEMNKALAEEYGEDIQDKISLYFGMDDRKKAKLFLEMNPEVSDALDDQTAYISNNPQLMKYYGGIDTLERYYTGKMYDQLEAKFGDNITDVESGYFNIYDKAERKAYLRANPQLKAYWDEKDKLKEYNLRQVVQFGNNLPEPKPELRSDAEPANPTQEELEKFAQPEQKMSFDQWQGVIGESASSLILDYYYSGEELPKALTSNLNYMADQYGYESGNDLLREILMSLPQEQP